VKPWPAEKSSGGGAMRQRDETPVVKPYPFYGTYTPANHSACFRTGVEGVGLSQSQEGKSCREARTISGETGAEG
jgi:hypothetical protein